MNKKKYNKQTNPELYEKWHSMKKRCYNPNAWNYKYYGGRGIKVCEKWQEFSNFYKWAIKNGFQSGLTIERINNNGNYEPKNCKWIPLKEQYYNRRSNNWITINGETLSLQQWSEKTGIHITTIRGRQLRGKTGTDLIKPPLPNWKNKK